MTPNKQRELNPTVSNIQIQSQGEAAKLASDGLAAYNANDYAKALSSWTKAAGQGNAMAQNNLGVMYANGTGVTKDDKQAVYWYRKAADQEHSDAQFNLANMYAYGRGVDTSDEDQLRSQAFYWIQKSAANGDAQAQQYVRNAKTIDAGATFMVDLLSGKYDSEWECGRCGYVMRESGRPASCRSCGARFY